MFFKKVQGSSSHSGGNRSGGGKYTDEHQKYEEGTNHNDRSKDTDAPMTNHSYSHVQKSYRKKQQQQQQYSRRDSIEDYRDVYEAFHDCPNNQPEVSEEYDIASNISGLTNESDFTVTRFDNGLFSNKRTKAKNKRKDRDHAKTTSFILPNIRRLSNVRGRKCRQDEEKQQRRSNHRTRSHSPDRSHAAESLFSTGSNAVGMSTANGYPGHHRNTPAPPARQSIFDARMESYLLRKRSKSADGRQRRPSPREPSPTRQAHPGLHYAMERRRSKGRQRANKLASPEPDGTKLEDYAFRASRYQVPTPTNVDRVEPLGTRLDNYTTVLDTPGTKEMYVEDMKSAPYTNDFGLGTATIHFQERKAKIQDIYRDIEKDDAANISFKGLDAEVAEIEAQLPPLTINRGAPSLNTNATKKTGNQKPLKETLLYSNPLHEQILNENFIKTSKQTAQTDVFDPSSGKENARVCSHITKNETSQLNSEVNKENIPPVLKSPHEPPVDTVAKETIQLEDISSLVADKSDSFDWKAFANYLDSRDVGAPLHRSKYRSLFNSSPQEVDDAFAEANTTAPMFLNHPGHSMKKSRSTGELLKRSLSPEDFKWDRKSRSEDLRWRSEYIEFSPRETGGFLQATCFEQSKPITMPMKEKAAQSRDMELDWMESIANGIVTINHNDSHELNIKKTQQHLENEQTLANASGSMPVTAASRSRVSSSKKEQIRTITNEASKKSLLSPSEDDDNDSSIFDEDIIAGLYPSHEKPAFKKHRHIRQSSTNDVARQLPFQVTPSPPKSSSHNAESFTDLAKQPESKRPYNMDVAPVNMSASQRRKIISDYLSFRDESVTNRITKATFVTSSPEIPPDPPESKSKPVTRSRPVAAKAKTKKMPSSRTTYFDAYGQSHYDPVPPTLGISPRSVVPRQVEGEKDYNSVTVLGGKSVKSMSSTIASKKSFTSSHRSSGERSNTVSGNKTKNGFCFPLSRVGTLNCYSDSRGANNNQNADGYAYLPSDASSSAGYAPSSVDVRSVKLPLTTPKTASSRKSFSPSAPGSGVVTLFSTFSSRPSATATPNFVATSNEDDWYMSPMHESVRRPCSDQVPLRRVNL